MYHKSHVKAQMLGKKDRKICEKLREKKCYVSCVICRMSPVTRNVSVIDHYVLGRL